MNHLRDRKFTTDSRIAENKDNREYGLPEGMGTKHLIRLVRDVAPIIGLPGGAIDLLALYYSQTQDRDWQAGNACKSWYSVKKAAKIRTVDSRSIYNYNKALVEAGIVAYCDYGNYRRFGFRQDGLIIDDMTFGVDLKPVIERLEEFQAIADRLVEAEILHKAARYQASALRRKIINNLPEEFSHDSDFENGLKARPRNTWPLERVQELVDRLDQLWMRIVAFYESQLSQLVKTVPENLDAEEVVDSPKSVEENVETAPDAKTEQNHRDGGEIFRHRRKNFPTHIYKNYNYDNRIVDVGIGVENSGKVDFEREYAELEDHVARGDAPHADYVPPNLRQTESGRNEIELEAIFQVIENYCIGTYFELMITSLPCTITSLIPCAEKSCRKLGIHPSAWQEAIGQIGAEMAAVAVLIIQAKRGEIERPGGYLRAMTRKDRVGALYLNKTIRKLNSK